MDVFLVPVSRATYELYCEHVDEPEAHGDEPPAGLFARLKFRFHQVLAEAERERRQGNAARAGDTWWARSKRRALRWVAESIAEQRLLWNLRRHHEATLHYPDDIEGPNALRTARLQLTRDFEKHRFWLAIDAVLLALSALLILIPGPNIVGYYFAFRVVGHFFSVRGARNGLDRVEWTTTPSAPLTELRQALALDPAGRLRQAEAVASRLRLDHLATFFQRTAVSS